MCLWKCVSESDLETGVCVARWLCVVVKQASDCRQDRVVLLCEIPFLRDIKRKHAEGELI